MNAERGMRNAECVEPLRIIEAVNRLSPSMREICRNGSCYRLYELLAAVFPEAEPYFDADYHVVTRIGDLFYDIDGVHAPLHDADLMTPAERERQARNVARLDQARFVASASGKRRQLR